MSKIKSALLMKGSMPGNQMSIQKESSQGKADDKLAYVVSPPYSMTALSELYDMNSYHSRCCKVKAGVAVLLGYSIYDVEDEEKEHDEKAKQIDNLLKNSIPELFNMQLDFEIFGNGYLEVVRNKKYEVSEIYHIGARDCNLQYVGSGDNKKLMLKQVIGSTEMLYKPFEGDRYDKADERHEYIHLKNYNPNSRHYGVPDYMGAIATMYLDKSANDYNTAKFTNNAVPDSIIKMYGFDKDADTENDIKNFFQGNFKGTDNAGKVLLLWAEAKEGHEIEIEKMGAEIKEASFRGLRMDNREEVLAAHGVPARLAGVESAAKLSGGNETREQLKLFNEIVIIPKQKALARLLNDLIERGLNIKNWKVKFDTFEFANAAEDATFYQTMVTSGILEPNEARVEMGYPAMEKEPEKPEDKKEKEPVTKADAIKALTKQITGLGKQVVGIQRALEDLRDSE
jgi:PBSX family phage portal protein